LKEWAESGVLLNVWRAFLSQLLDRQKVRWDECFIDGMFLRAKEGGLVGKIKIGKQIRLMLLVDGAGTPLGIHL
jgi:hypothetical protein